MWVICVLQEELKYLSDTASILFYFMIYLKCKYDGKHLIWSICISTWFWSISWYLKYAKRYFDSVMWRLYTFLICSYHHCFSHGWMEEKQLHSWTIRIFAYLVGKNIYYAFNLGLIMSRLQEYIISSPGLCWTSQMFQVWNYMWLETWLLNFNKPRNSIIIAK